MLAEDHLQRFGGRILGLEDTAAAAGSTSRAHRSCGSLDGHVVCDVEMLVKWHRKCFGHCFNDANRCKSRVKTTFPDGTDGATFSGTNFYIPTNDAGPTYLLQTHHIAAPSLTLRSAEPLIMRHAVFCERQSEEPCGLDTSGVIPVWKVEPQKSCPQQCIYNSYLS